MAENGKDFIKRIETLLSSKGLRIGDLYKTLPQITPTNVYAWKTRCLPSVTVSIAIARYLGTSVEWLVTGEGIRSTSPDTDATVLALKARLRQIADIAEGKEAAKNDSTC